MCTQDPQIISPNTIHNENLPCEWLFMTYIINKELSETRHVFLGSGRLTHFLPLLLLASLFSITVSQE